MKNSWQTNLLTKLQNVIEMKLDWQRKILRDLDKQPIPALLELDGTACITIFYRRTEGLWKIVRFTRKYPLLSTYNCFTWTDFQQQSCMFLYNLITRDEWLTDVIYILTSILSMGIRSMKKKKAYISSDCLTGSQNELIGEEAFSEKLEITYKLTAKMLWLWLYD